ncbi:MAG TPA: LysM peptidoglycan-binding domain-containing protein [Dongiaceae bacterium]|nr:LysM peptidoglycan-binding domain-containing protein [Dongiaceae bacterium]
MKLRYLVLAGAMAQAGLAHGMGLGELDLQSYLGNPLQADLKVLTPGDYDQQDIRVRIARPEVYEQFGIHFDSFHNQIDFSVLSAPGGEIRVQAVSRERVVEPFLDIVVELSWPQGTTYRRYSLLLDPPAYAARWRKTSPTAKPVEEAALAMAKPAQMPKSVVSKPVTTQAWSAPQSRPQRPATAAVDRSTLNAVNTNDAHAYEARPYEVRSGDSLWKIARRLQPGSGESLTALMQRLVAANPQAFVAGDPDRLRLGATLYLPNTIEGAPAQTTAVADNASHSASVPSSSRVPAPVAEIPAAVAPAVPRTPAVDLQAELASAQQATVPETTEEIRATLARLQQEKTELVQFQDQLKQEMVNVLERRVAVTEALQQIEQNHSASTQPVSAAAEPALETSSAETPTATAALAAEKVTLSQLLSPHKTTAPRLEAAAMTGQDLLPRDASARNMSNLLVAQSGPSLWYLVAMLPLGLLIVLLGMRSQRVHRIRQSESMKDGELYELVFGSRRDRSRSDSPEQVRQALEQIREKAGQGQADQFNADTHLNEMGNSDQSVSRDDLKQMIDLYMLYSQYQKAQNVILTEISKRPGRADLRLYLMQVYAAMNDWQSFDDQLEVLRRMGNAQLVEEAMKLRSSAPR